MGLSSPAQVLSIDSGTGIMDVRGARRRVRLALLTAAGQRVDVGDWLFVQLGLAVAWLNPDDDGGLARRHAERAPAPTTMAGC
jgi:hydrogenase maturation factor